jgi:hypothetical protein
MGHQRPNKPGKRSIWGEEGPYPSRRRPSARRRESTQYAALLSKKKMQYAAPQFFHTRVLLLPIDTGPTCPRNPRRRGSFQHLQTKARTRFTWTIHPASPTHDRLSGWRRRTKTASTPWDRVVDMGPRRTRGPHRIRSPITTRTPGTHNTPRNAVESKAACPPITQRPPET